MGVSWHNRDRRQLIIDQKSRLFISSSERTDRWEHRGTINNLIFRTFSLIKFEVGLKGRIGASPRFGTNRHLLSPNTIRSLLTDSHLAQTIALGSNMEGIPQELYPSIFIHLPPKDWVTITLTSRAFHYETSRLLYRDVNLCHCSRTQIHSWADAVAYNSFLSNLVRTLRLPTVIPIKRSALVPSRQLVVALKNAFEAVVNLVSLKIRDENRKPPSKHASYLDFDMLVKLGSFRLKTLHVFGNETLCDPYEMVSFLSKQPEIEDWAQGISCPATKSAITEDMLSSSLLPHLSTFGLMCHYPCDLPLLNFATSRPLVRLAVQFDIYSETQMEDLNPLIRIMKCVHRCHETLLLFHYCDWNEESSISTPPAGQIRLIAQQLPRLKALSYSREKFWITVRLSYLFIHLKIFPIKNLTGQSRQHNRAR